MLTVQAQSSVESQLNEFEKLINILYPSEHVDSIFQSKASDAERVRFLEIVNILSNTIDESDINKIIIAYQNKEKRLTYRINLLGILTKIQNKSIFKIIVVSLKDENEEIRLEAVIALGKQRNQKAVDVLIPLLNDKNPNIRRLAINSLSNFKENKAVKYIKERLNDEDEGVRRSAQRALKEISDTADVKSTCNKRLHVNAYCHAPCVEPRGPRQKRRNRKDQWASRIRNQSP